MDVAVADRCQEVVEPLVFERRRDVVQLYAVNREALQLFVDQLAATLDVLVTLLPLEPLADLLARVRRADVAQVRVQPVSARTFGAARGDDLDDVPVLQ